MAKVQNRRKYAPLPEGVKLRPHRGTVTAISKLQKNMCIKWDTDDVPLAYRVDTGRVRPLTDFELIEETTMASTFQVGDRVVSKMGWGRGTVTKIDTELRCISVHWDKDSPSPSSSMYHWHTAIVRPLTNLEHVEEALNEKG